MKEGGEIIDMIDEEKVLSYQLRPPFDEMLKLRDQRTSRTGAMNIELLLPLANSIIENWKIGTFEQIMLMKNNQQMGYNQIYEY